jgi:hypothetical protein
VSLGVVFLPVSLRLRFWCFCLCLHVYISDCVCLFVSVFMSLSLFLGLSAVSVSVSVSWSLCLTLSPLSLLFFLLISSLFFSQRARSFGTTWWSQTALTFDTVSFALLRRSAPLRRSKRVIREEEGQERERGRKRDKREREIRKKDSNTDRWKELSSFSLHVFTFRLCRIVQSHCWTQRSSRTR